MIAAGGLYPHWVSTLYLVFMCVIVCSVFTTPGYCFCGSVALIKDQHMMNYLNHKFVGCTLVSLNTVSYKHEFH